MTRKHDYVCRHCVAYCTTERRNGVTVPLDDNGEPHPCWLREQRLAQAIAKHAERKVSA